MRAHTVESFPPVVRDDCRALVLGSMPSVASLRKREYYGNPRHLFWQLMGELFGAGPELPYAERLARLQERRVALWDVAHRCRRHKSSDASMRDVVPNDVAALAERCPELRAVFTNGRKSQELFHRLIAPQASGRLARLPVHYLPSTSPANASIPVAEKRRAWRALLACAGGEHG